MLQLNEYETDPYFLHFFQRNTTVCLIIHVFCKSCEPEIVFALICTLAEQFHVCKSYKTRESTLLCIGNFEENMDLSDIYLAVPTLIPMRRVAMTAFICDICQSLVQFRQSRAAVEPDLSL